MKSIWTGIMLAFQFFSVLPIKRQLPMTRETMTAMYGALPIIGLTFGVVLASTYTILEFAGVSTFFLAVSLVVVHILCTGGLHLDGYVDVSDAYFSYGEKQKRLEILEDPRTGAFGVISVVVLLLVQIAAIFEMLTQQFHLTAVLLICIPIILRCGILIYFTSMSCAKTSGIAYYFSTNINHKIVRLVAIAVLTLVTCIALYLQLFAVIAAVAVQLVIIALYRKWSYKHFGGMNGDLTGALYEGSNVMLWLTVLLFI